MAAVPTTTIAEADLTALACRALEGLGVDPDDAARVVRILVLGDLFGHHTHGVLRLESYGERLAIGGINPQPLIREEQLAPALMRIDGDNALGPLVGMQALEGAMRCARNFGIGLVLVRDSNHFGAISPYSYIAAGEGFATIIGTNASVTIAPTGGKEARLGNNPIAFGVPNPGGAPIILDMAVSVAARGKIRDALKRGKPIPDTWAVDRDGHPTTDPQAALDGFLLPVGGYKGYGLSAIVDLFAGLLSGASFLTNVVPWMEEPGKPQGLGHFFIAIDTRVLGGAEWLASRMGDFASILHGTPPAEPGQPVLLPGEKELRNLAHHRQHGVPIETSVLDKLRVFATGDRPLLS
ncbi:MAG TPA: Ldh family oxidoreductase [Usitatibacter sp.]|jgi:LDH2 family malate/lactate/ureidoglycolate dehydrogenase|nr:Ldh family oxidoreductase [Usitatibacter sp.]